MLFLCKDKFFYQIIPYLYRKKNAFVHNYSFFTFRFHLLITVIARAWAQVLTVSTGEYFYKKIGFHQPPKSFAAGAAVSFGGR